MADASGSQPLPFEGFVDGADVKGLRGWVWFPSAPDEAANIEIVVGDEVVDRLTADQARGDLEAAGKRGGKCAFAWKTMRDLTDVRVRLVDGRELPDGPWDLPGDKTPAFESGVAFAGYGRAVGWIRFLDFPAEAIIVEAYVDGAHVGSILANQTVADLSDTPRATAHSFDLGWAHALGAELGVLELRLADGRTFARLDFKAGTYESGPPQPVRLLGFDGFLERFDDTILGWAAPINRGPHAVFSVCEGDAELLRIEAKDWRKDLEDDHQGDGRGGFELKAPDCLRDGKVRRLDVRVDGRSVLEEPLRVWLPPPRPEPPAPPPPPPTLQEQLERQLNLPEITRKLQSAAQRASKTAKDLRQALSPVHFSFIVNFYNMRREAERTLTSLTRAYQLDSADINYEVICIDNGSNPPLDEDWIKSFGPEFRLFRPSKILSSPCFAINEAAAQARGRHVVILVDGAHVLSPGVFREATAAIDENAKAVVAVRHWFIGGDQRWLSIAGYTRELEDILFARVGWPKEPYRLFEIGAPMHENPNHWFDPIAESNCLFVPAELWRRMGGMDESFNEPGGGFCNLDLLRRAAKGEGGVTCLLGEATFHQFHEGTTTNVTDAEKDARVRSYANAYRDLRGETFANLDTPEFRVRGRMQHGSFATRQRPLYPAPLGITNNIRPGPVDRWLDSGAVEYLNGVYAETGLYQRTQWRGKRVDLAPADLIALQDIVREVRPERVVLSAEEPGLIEFLTDTASLNGLEQIRFVCVADAPPDHPHPLVDYVIGAPYEAQTLKRVTALVGAAESTLVLFTPRADDYLPLEPLKLYSRLVSFRSYLIVLRTVLGQPWLGYSKYWLKRAINLFVEQSDFAKDESRTEQLISLCSNGYLLRIRAPEPNDDDGALDHLAS